MNAPPTWAERVAILRDVLFVGLILLLAWKVLASQWVVAPGDVPLSDITALGLALFAMLLSALFYFKATETSNRFYDNTHKFTRDVSEILGRIESGFGERLRHIDEGYSHIRDHVTQTPLVSAQAEDQLRAEEQVAERAREERDALIRELIEKAEVQQEEKVELARRLARMDGVLEASRQEIGAHRAALGQQNRRIERMTHFLQTNWLPRTGLVRQSPQFQIRHAFESMREAFPAGFLLDMSESGFLEDSGALTGEGIEFIRSLSPG